MFEMSVMAQNSEITSCFPKAFTPWIGFELTIPAQHLTHALQNPDSIQAALELGRLDFVTALLAVLSIILAIASIGGFWLVRGAATQAAREAAVLDMRTELPRLAEGQIRDILLTNPELIAQAIRNDLSVLAKIADAYDTLYGKKTERVAPTDIAGFETGSLP
jgi:hypothetical protein